MAASEVGRMSVRDLDLGVLRCRLRRSLDVLGHTTRIESHLHGDFRLLLDLGELGLERLGEARGVLSADVDTKAAVKGAKEAAKAAADVAQKTKVEVPVVSEIDKAFLSRMKMSAT
jgi:hypothetical protein